MLGWKRIVACSADERTETAASRSISPKTDRAAAASSPTGTSPMPSGADHVILPGTVRDNRSPRRDETPRDRDPRHQRAGQTRQRCLLQCQPLRNGRGITRGGQTSRVVGIEQLTTRGGTCAYVTTRASTCYQDQRFEPPTITTRRCERTHLAHQLNTKTELLRQDAVGSRNSNVSGRPGQLGRSRARTAELVPRRCGRLNRQSRWGTTRFR